jgi:hypothetical protein
MASEARIAANRLNAQKSTGPRTAEGKAVVAQNAVKHGLPAREGVLRGEDGEEFARHRETLLEELNPTGALEVILAARIVDLTWRLRRAAQDQNETFGALYDRHTAGAPEPAEPVQRGATLGRMILEDYSAGAVLERLLRYERRIEGSLLRNLSELRRVHDQRRKADGEAAGTLARWREEDDRAWKARAFAPWGPGDSPLRADVEAPQQCDAPSCLDTPGAGNAAVGNEMCQTNPIGRGVSSWKCQVSSEQGAVANPQGLPTSNFTLETAAQPQLCGTNPIGPEQDTNQVLSGTAVMIDSAPEGVRKTNPISGGVSSGKSEVASTGSALPISNFTLPTSDEPPEGGSPSKSCQTNPISGAWLGGEEGSRGAAAAPHVPKYRQGNDL